MHAEPILGHNKITSISLQAERSGHTTVG